MNTLSFFNEVNQDTLIELVDFLANNQIELKIKIAGQYLKTNVLARKNTKYLSLVKFSSDEFSNEPITCQFQFKEDKYFFKSHLVSSTTGYSFEIPSSILQLQRRNDYRTAIPASVFYKCEIITVNGIKTDINAEISDISLGGFQISIAKNTSSIKQDDELDLKLKLDKFEFQKITLTAKHVKKTDPQNSTLIGTSLLDPDSELKSELLSLLMYLDRVQRGKTEY